ncbi:MAG: IS481 family transposase [Candidatus Krumholzibacteriia bacterium]
MEQRYESRHAKWARFRFSVVGGLLASPPPKGELRTELNALAAKTWTHPITGAPAWFGLSTIERWYYTALKAGSDPVGALRRKVRDDAGTHPSLDEPLRLALESQHRDHRRWSYKLHYDNMGARVRRNPELGALPSYSAVRRFMRAKGLKRAKGRRTPKTKGGELAAQRFEAREVRSYEASHVAGLYHADFHECSRAVLAPDGTLKRPKLYGCLDDRSRLACHLQWYWSESADTFAHGTQQAFMKRGLSWEFMTDCGPAETAAEVSEGFERQGVTHKQTLPYSPYQNAKKEVFWVIVEGRLMPMLEGVEPLTLELLNEATQAWVELDYNREVHSELGVTPLERWLEGPTVARDCPDPQALRDSFRRTVTRRQRQSDGTITVERRRFEVPSRYGHFERVAVRYATWDLTNVHLIDRKSDTVLCRLWPQDKERNADGLRRRRQGPALSERGTPLAPPATGIAPLLAEYIEEYSAQGLPAAYLSLDERYVDEGDEGDDDECSAGEAVLA